MANVTQPPILDSTGQQIVSKLNNIQTILAQEVTPATTASLGIVKPDGQTILIDATGTISSASTVALATTAVAGIVKPDGSTINVDANGVISASASVRALTNQEIDDIWDSVFNAPASTAS